MEFRCKLCGKVWHEGIDFEGRMEYTICESCAEKALSCAT